MDRPCTSSFCSGLVKTESESMDHLRLTLEKNAGGSRN